VCKSAKLPVECQDNLNTAVYVPVPVDFANSECIKVMDSIQYRTRGTCSTARLDPSSWNRHTQPHCSKELTAIIMTDANNTDDDELSKLEEEIKRLQNEIARSDGMFGRDDFLAELEVRPIIAQTADHTHHHHHHHHLHLHTTYK
jgi:hypothetical protein